MSSTTSKIDNETPGRQKSRFAKQKVIAIARLQTLGSTFKRRNLPPPVVFPPPSWDLDDETIHRSRSNHLNTSAVDPDHAHTSQELAEPVTFARNLKSLIESATNSQAAVGSSLKEGTNKDTGVFNGLSREPVPPNLDTDLLRMLASEDVMNGSRATPTENEGLKKRDNVWNILAGLKKDNTVEQLEVEEEEDGLMMYAPLEPKGDSHVELAVPEAVVEPAAQPEASSSTWPQQPKKIVEKHVRVPSTTELSVLTAWWGYRLYLPPPVMAKLDNRAIKSAGRAAMITTALKWLLEKIPLAIIPVQFRAAVKLLKQLGPLTGYIGVFIAWSWDRVRSLDEGNGVVLTATWLLPVALLPMAWDAGNIYRPILPPKPEELKKMEEAAKEERRAAEKGKKNANLGQKNQDGERKKSWFQW